MKPVDLWNHLVDEAGEDEIERAASVSVEQAEKELAAAGFDVAAERAKASAFLDDLESGKLEQPAAEAAPKAAAPVAEPVPAAATAVPQRAPRARERRGAPPLVWLVAAAMLGALVYALLRPAPPAPQALPPPVPSPPLPFEPAAPNAVAAADLRREAAAACEAQDWNVCLAKLDSARALDPDGDGAPAVKRDRDRAIKSILGVKPRPSAP